jgi:four helix bundle protein
MPTETPGEPSIPTGSYFPTGIEIPLVKGGQNEQSQVYGTSWKNRDRHRLCCKRGMDKILSFRDLDVWQLAMDLTDSIIADLRPMARTEVDLKRQMQRAAISVPANIAEGWRRKKRRGAYQNHVSIAMGSQGELETELEIAFRNGFLKRENCAKSLELCGRVGLMLNRLHDSLD